MAELFSNNARSTLASGIGAGDLTVTVQAGDGALFPSPGGSDFFRVTLFKKSTGQIEICQCTSRATDILTIVRAQESTTALVMLASDLVESRPTAAFFNSLAVTSVKVQENDYNYFADTGAADAYVVTMNPVPAAYGDGLGIYVKITNTSTGACTINANTLGATSIKLLDGNDPPAGALVAGQIYELMYNGTVFSLLTPQVSSFMATVLNDANAAAARVTLAALGYGDNSGEASGTDTYTVTLGQTLVAYATGQPFFVKFGNTNTVTNPTLDIDTVGVRNLLDRNGAALLIGALPQEAVLKYNGTSLLVLNEASHVSGTWTPTIQDASFSDAEGQTYIGQYGSYTKVGNRVFVQGHILINSLGTLTASSDAYIAGLPFTSINSPNSEGSIAVASAIGLSLPNPRENVMGTVVINATTILLTAWDRTAGTDNVLISEVSSLSSLIFNGQYTV